MAVGTTESSCLDASAGIRNNTKIGEDPLKDQSQLSGSHLFQKDQIS